MQKNIMRLKKRLILKRNFLCILFVFFMSFTFFVSFVDAKNYKYVSGKKYHTQAQTKTPFKALQTKK